VTISVTPFSATIAEIADASDELTRTTDDASPPMPSVFSRRPGSPGER
jgi:hypothetical protein